MSISFSGDRPSPQDIGEEFLSAAVLIPSLSKDAATDHATLDKAIGQVDLKALDNADQLQFDSSAARCGVHDGSAEPDDEAGDAASDGQLAHRRGVAVALDGDCRHGEEHVSRRRCS